MDVTQRCSCNVRPYRPSPFFGSAIQALFASCPHAKTVTCNGWRSSFWQSRRATLIFVIFVLSSARNKVRGLSPQALASLYISCRAICLNCSTLVLLAKRTWLPVRIWPWAPLSLHSCIIFIVFKFVSDSRRADLSHIPGPFVARYTDAWRLYQVVKSYGKPEYLFAKAEEDLWRDCANWTEQSHSL
jgi:hypothetical protein